MIKFPIVLPLLHRSEGLSQCFCNLPNTLAFFPQDPHALTTRFVGHREVNLTDLFFILGIIKVVGFEHL